MEGYLDVKCKKIERLKRQNLIVVADSEHHSILQKRFSRFYKVFDRKSLIEALYSIILSHIDGFDDLNPSHELLSSGSVEELKRIERCISIRKAHIIRAMDNLNYVHTGGVYCFQNKSECTSLNIYDDLLTKSEFCKIIDAIPMIGNLVSLFIQRESNQGGFVIITDSVQGTELSQSTVISFSEKNSELGKYGQSIKSNDPRHKRLALQPINLSANESSMASKVIRRLAYRDKHQENMQETKSIPRDSFKWSSNPLIYTIRELSMAQIIEEVKRVNKYGVTEFDLAIQVMMNIGAYNAETVWHGEGIQEITRLLSTERYEAAIKSFNEGMSSGLIKLNYEFVNLEITRQANRLVKYFSELKVMRKDGYETPLPASIMGDYTKNPFAGIERPTISAKERKYGVDPVTGQKSMEVIEKESGKRIIFKPISSEIAKLYSLGFCNLHYFREGEIAHFGAFLEGHDMPFAYSSYSTISRAYNRNIVESSGFNSASMLESTRAWNCYWSPENTMSTLFAYCHEVLKEIWPDHKMNPLHSNLKGVITSINPNLNFKANAFKGVRFHILSLKPTNFTYLKDKNGFYDFMPLPSIASSLGLSLNEVKYHPEFSKNKIPFLPTVDMLCLFEKIDEEKLLEQPIRIIDNNTFSKN